MHFQGTSLILNQTKNFVSLHLRVYNLHKYAQFIYLYPRHKFVHSSVPLVEFITKFYVKSSQMCISQKPFIRKHSYLGHGYLGGSASINFGPRVHAPGWG